MASWCEQVADWAAEQSADRVGERTCGEHSGAAQSAGRPGVMPNTSQCQMTRTYEICATCVNY